MLTLGVLAGLLLSRLLQNRRELVRPVAGLSEARTLGSTGATSRCGGDCPGGGQ